MQNIAPKQAHQLLLNKQAIFIDVREPAELLSGYINGAINMPMSTICVADILSTGKQSIVVYCHLGMRSQWVCAQLADHEMVHNLQGGLLAWQQENLETVLPVSSK